MLYLVTPLSFLLCLAATPVVRRIALKKGWIAYPSEQRWHKKPTALLGGIAIYLGIAVPLLLMAQQIFPAFSPISSEHPILWTCPR
jgi:UDP-GlcNAc:undecaprenyl-phosphate GlcNAc-1-phosphate transferase